ncbi:MAG: PfkB family carbohydrate kinase, partial [Nitrospiraceae bacterium]
EVPGFAVEVVDTTAAGDSFDAAVIYGYLSGLEPVRTATLANAVGAAKARKRGTGHQVPTVDEIRNVLENAGHNSAEFLDLSARS